MQNNLLTYCQIKLLKWLFSLKKNYPAQMALSLYKNKLYSKILYLPIIFFTVISKNDNMYNIGRIYIFIKLVGI